MASCYPLLQVLLSPREGSRPRDSPCTYVLLLLHAAVTILCISKQTKVSDRCIISFTESRGGEGVRLYATAVSATAPASTQGASYLRAYQDRKWYVCEMQCQGAPPAGGPGRGLLAAYWHSSS